MFIPLETIYEFNGAHTVSKFLGAYLVFLLIVNGSLKYISEPFKNKKTLWILLFGAVAIFSIILSKDPDHSSTYVLSLWLSIVLYFTLILMIRDTRVLNIANISLIVGAVLSVLSPIVLGFGSAGGDMWMRYGGLWGDPNEFASILLVLLPISVYVYIISQNIFLKIISVTGFVIFLMGIIFTYSRGAYLSFIVLALLSMFKIIRGKNKVKILAITIPLIIIGALIIHYTVADSMLERVETLRSVGSSGVHTVKGSINIRRYLYLDLAPSIFLEHPIIGVGFRGFKSYSNFGFAVHNTYLEVLTGTGLLGFIPFMAVLFFSWRELKKVQAIKPINKDDRYLTLYAHALELGFLSYLVAAIFLSLDVTKMTWLQITLCAVLYNIARIQKPPSDKPKYKP